MSDMLLYEKRDRVAIITLNRPQSMNALNIELWEELYHTLEKFRDDEDSWVGIITGTGDKAFCAGWDLKDEAARRAKGLPSPNFLPIHELEIWKPLIAAINGYAIAGGWMVAQICDVRIAAEHAEMGIAEARWNLPAFWVVGLAQQVNLGHALEIVLWGDKRLTAQRAYEIGWVNKVVPKGKLMEEAMSWAERMLLMGPRAVRNFKQILYRATYLPPRDAYAFAKALEYNLQGMEDTKEGPTAFAQKRPPKYKNK